VRRQSVHIIRCGVCVYIQLKHTCIHITSRKRNYILHIIYYILLVRTGNGDRCARPPDCGPACGHMYDMAYTWMVHYNVTLLEDHKTSSRGDDTRAIKSFIGGRRGTAQEDGRHAYIIYVRRMHIYIMFIGVPLHLYMGPSVEEGQDRDPPIHITYYYRDGLDTINGHGLYTM